MATDTRAKLEETARMLDGRIKEPEAGSGPAICVQGYVSGFPCRLEAFSPDWPFGVNYSIKTEIAPRNPGYETFALTVIPRMGKGLFGFVTKLLFFEATGIKVQDKNLQKTFIFNCENRSSLDRFLGYSAIPDALLKLHALSFNELKIVSNAGLYLSQPKSFSKLDLGACRETFRLLAEIGQVLYERF
jgi:hypothetical protein